LLLLLGRVNLLLRKDLLKLLLHLRSWFSLTHHLILVKIIKTVLRRHLLNLLLIVLRFFKVILKRRCLGLVKVHIVLKLFLGRFERRNAWNWGWFHLNLCLCLWSERRIILNLSFRNYRNLEFHWVFNGTLKLKFVFIRRKFRWSRRNHLI